MTRDGSTQWVFDVQRVERQLAHIEQEATAVLTALRCPTNPVQMFVWNEHLAPWPEGTSARSKRRARYALHVLVHIGTVRQHLGFVHPNAPLAVEAALILGWLTSQLKLELGLDVFTKTRATLAGSAPKKKTIRRTARRDAQLRRDAAKLSPKLSVSAKAERLARTRTLSADRIRRIIG